MVVIICTGTPGTGKTFISTKIARILKFDYLYVGDVVKEFKLGSGKDRRLNSVEVDPKKLNKIIIKLIKNYDNVIIDGHLSQYLPSKYVDLCLVTKCDLKVLKKRLEMKRYSRIKVRENLDAEIFDVCLVEALENKHNTMIVDTSKKVDLSKLVRLIRRKI